MSENPAERYPNPDILVSTKWLAEHLNDPSVRVLAMSNPMNYMAGHIPNASLVFYEQISMLRAGMPGAVATPEIAATTFSDLGVDNDKTVVIYGDPGTPSAARLFWTLDYLSHPKVKMLEVDISGWARQGFPVAREMPKFQKSQFSPKPDPAKIAEMNYILSNLRKPEPVLLDNRSPQEFAGLVRTGKRAGRIPGSVNLPWDQCASVGTVFRAASDLDKVFTGRGLSRDKEMICYCFVGERSAHSYVALRLMGYPKVKLYDRSFMEWGNNPDLPIEP